MGQGCVVVTSFGVMVSQKMFADFVLILRKALHTAVQIDSKSELNIWHLPIR